MKESSVGLQLAFGIIGWTLYFLVVFFVCNFIYHRLRGKAPGIPSDPRVVGGKTTTALAAWQERDHRLRRLAVGIGITLMLLPLFLPSLLKILYP